MSLVSVFRSGYRSTVGLLLLSLLGINAIAIAGVLSAHVRTRGAATREFQLQVDEHAKSVERDLANLRGDLGFLVGTASFRRLLDSFDESDPYRLRWAQRDAEAAALLFLRSRPELDRVLVVGPEDRPLVSIGRRGAAPIALAFPPDGSRPAYALTAADDPNGVRVFVDFAVDHLAPPDGEGWTIRIVPDESVDMTARGVANAGPADFRATQTVADPGWEPPIDWRLEATGSESAPFRFARESASDYSRTLWLNVGLIGLATGLGWLTLREARAVERLEAEQRQQRKVRELELGLLHRDRLAALGQMASGIAHEINNPLEGTFNYLRLAQEDLESGAPDEARDSLAKAQQGLDRIAAVVRETLARAAGPEDGRATLDLCDIARRTVDFSLDQASKCGVTLGAEVDGRPVLVVGNATTLGQLVLNLVMNACEAQERGGEVRVSVEAESETARLTVADRGPGIGPGDPDRLFEAFYSTKGSSGLGLFVCRTIAVDHAGSLTAHERAGGGARFVLTLPLARAEGVS